jgi:hypothetical protein
MSPPRKVLIKPSKEPKSLEPIENSEESYSRKMKMVNEIEAEEAERRKRELAKYHKNWDKLSDGIKKREDPERFLRESEAKALQMPEEENPKDLTTKSEEVPESKEVPGPKVQEESAPPDPVPPELEPPVETQIAPAETQANDTPPTTETKIKKLIQLKSISEEDKQKIMEELNNNIENPFYRLRGKGIAYKDDKMKKRAKGEGSVFDESVKPVKTKKSKAPPVKEENPPPDVTEVPPPFSDTSATASMAEVAAVETQVKPAPIKKRTLNLLNEARRNDLTDTGFVSGSSEEPPALGNRQRKKLNLSNLTGVLDLGENRLKLSIGGPFN